MSKDELQMAIKDIIYLFENDQLKEAMVKLFDLKKYVQ